MLREITKSVIRGNTTEQLRETLDGLVEAASFRSAQGMGTDERLGEMIAEIVTEMNAREIDSY